MFRNGASIFLIFLLFTLGGCDQTPTSKAHDRVLGILEKRSYPDAVQMVEKGLEKEPAKRELLEDRLILLLASGDRKSRPRLVDTQKRLDATGAGRELLRDQSLSPQAAVRQQVAWLFGVLNDATSAGTLQDLAEDREPEVRSEAIRSLAKFRLSANRNLFLIRLRDVNWMVRAESAAALEALGDKTSTRQLFRSANDPDDYVRSQVLDAIVAMADLSQKALYLENLESDHAGNRTAAGLALLALRQAEGTRALLELLQNPGTPDRAVIAVALSQTDAAWLADVFEKLVRQEKDAAVRGAILDYFSRRGDEQAQRVLKKAHWK